MEREDDVLALARKLIDALNRRDEETVCSVLAPDVLFRVMSSGERSEGAANVSESLFAYRRSFPDLREEIVNAFASGGQACIEVIGTGTYEGRTIPTISGSGRQIKLPLCHVMHANDGKLTEIDTYLDVGTIWNELDAVIPSGTER